MNRQKIVKLLQTYSQMGTQSHNSAFEAFANTAYERSLPHCIMGYRSLVVGQRTRHNRLWVSKEMFE